MELNIIETQEEGLDTDCTRKEIILHNNFKFEVLTYDSNGNGTKKIRIFTVDDKQVLEDIKIWLRYCWQRGYIFDFKNAEHPNSERYFSFSVDNRHAKKPLKMEDVLDRLAIVAEKRNSLINQQSSVQYVYAYLIYLFFSIDEEKIHALDFSNYFNILRFMYKCIYKDLRGASANYFSKDNEYYQKFNLFIKEQMEILKNKPINYFY